MSEKASHYFIEDESLEPNFEVFGYYYAGIKFTFTSNSGIFSPGHIDYATDLLLKTIDNPSGKLLDLGCGYGIIGIALGKTYGLKTTLSDINPRALECAEINCRNNDFSAEIIKSDCFENIKGKFDTITLNPPIHAGKKVIFTMYKEAAEHLEKDGKFFVVIQKKHGAESTVKMLNQTFGNCEILYKKKGFYVLKCIKQ